MVNLTILAGGYATFVASYHFDSDAGSLTLLNQSPTGANPSWITLHPTNSSILYAVNENDDGMLQSYTIGADGVLTGPFDQVESGGGAPAFTVALSDGQVAIPNYNTGNGKIIPTTTDPLHFATNASLITFPAPVSHPHMALEHAIEGGFEVLVPDLGGDTIWRLVEAEEPGNFTIQGRINQPTGSGPRHIRIYDDILYTVHELASTLTSQKMPAAPNATAEIVQQLSTVPPNNLTSPMWAAGEILVPDVHPDAGFVDPFIYTSNRNTGATVDPRGDTIAIFKILGDGQMELVQQVYTDLQQVRGMWIGGPNDEFIVAGGVVGTGGVVVYQRTEGGANLQEVARNTDIPTRTSFVFGDW